MQPQAQSRNKIYFLSDFHLGVPTKQQSIDREKRIVSFLQSIEGDAQRVFLLGDVFDFWFEYKRVVPKGSIRLLGQLLRMTDMGIKVDFFTGNHDLWQLDYFSKELGVSVHKEKTGTLQLLGKNFLLGHGDGLDNRDFKYLFIRFIFKHPFSRVIFTTLPTSWGLALASGWSFLSRKSHKQVDMTYLGKQEPIYQFCQKFLQNHDIDYFIFGHRHLCCQEEILCQQTHKKALYTNTGTWLNGKYPYAVFDGQSLQLKEFQ